MAATCPLWGLLPTALSRDLVRKRRATLPGRDIREHPEPVWGELFGEGLCRHGGNMPITVVFLDGKRLGDCNSCSIEHGWADCHVLQAGCHDAFMQSQERCFAWKRSNGEIEHCKGTGVAMHRLYGAVDVRYFDEMPDIEALDRNCPMYVVEEDVAGKRWLVRD